MPVAKLDVVVLTWAAVALAAAPSSASGQVETGEEEEVMAKAEEVEQGELGEERNLWCCCCCWLAP